jgi:Abortive infection alpha
MTEILEVVQNAFITNVVAQGTMPVLKITCTKLKPLFLSIISHYYPLLEPMLINFSNDYVYPKLEAIPVENRVEPSVKIFKRVLEGVLEVPDEPLLKEMFANLLVSDMNTGTKSKVHPKFASILADMSATEAKFLQAFKETTSLPMLEPNDERRFEHIDIIYHPTFDSTGLSYEEIGQAILSFRSNGVLLAIPDGFVNLDPEPDNPYSEWCKKNNPCWGSYLYQPIKLSRPFGMDFRDVVLSEDPANG